jgi:hypothetical protein
MSKNFWGQTSNREPVFAKSTEQQEKVQVVSTLYELGLLSNSDKRPRRVKDRGQVKPNGGDRVAEAQSKKGTQ